MTAPAIDDFLLRLAPVEPRDVDPALLRARASVAAGLADLRMVPDSALEAPWTWGGGELDVRYGFYRQYEAFEEVRASVRRRFSGMRIQDTAARPIVAAASAARWDLHGVLAGVTDDDLDRDPGNNQWTIRQTLGHIVNGQRAYGWFTAWWLSQRELPPDDFPARPPEDTEIGFPDEGTESRGSLADIVNRLDEVLDGAASVFAPLSDAELAARARWSGILIDVRFRLGRWPSHLREHTIQIEKTHVFLGRETTEVDRLLRLIAAAYGRLEEELFMLPADQAPISEALTSTESVAAAFAAQAAEVAAAARS
jgi:hypothetical protein